MEEMPDEKVILAGIVVIVLAAGFLLIFQPWEEAFDSGGGGTQENQENQENEGVGENQQAEEVLYKYEASFQYLGSEENQRLQGCYILLPCPTVNGEPVFEDPYLNVKYENSEVENFYWELWGPVEGESGSWMELEVRDGNVIQWVGKRAVLPPENDFFSIKYHTPDNSFIDMYNLHGFNWKILLQNGLDNLYSGEKLKSVGYFWLPSEDAEKVTLQEDNEIIKQKYGKVVAGKTVGDVGLDQPIPIDISFRAQLMKKKDSDFLSVENYSFTGKNILSWDSGWQELSSAQ